MGLAPTTLDSLAAALGHDFTDPRHLMRALCHASVASAQHMASNERLEFLGDRVLGLIIAEVLCATFPEDSVGELARRHAQLVSGEALQQVARAIDLPRHIRVAHGTQEADGAPNPSIIADACEAVIAALYLDGGLAAAAAFVHRAWAPLLAAAATAPKDPKTALQEWAQGRGLGLPVYEEIGREGPDHQPLFLVRVSIADGRAASAAGPSKRAAEAAAAKALIDTLGAAKGEP